MPVKFNKGDINSTCVNVFNSDLPRQETCKAAKGRNIPAVFDLDFLTPFASSVIFPKSLVYHEPGSRYDD